MVYYFVLFICYWAICDFAKSEDSDRLQNRKMRSVSGIRLAGGKYFHGTIIVDSPYIDHSFLGFRRNSTMHYMVGKVGRLYDRNPELEYIYAKGEFNLKEYPRGDRKGVYYLERDSVSWEVVTNKALDPNKPTTGLACFQAVRFGFDKFNAGMRRSLQPLEKEIHNTVSDLFLPLPPPSLSSSVEVDLDNLKLDSLKRNERNGGFVFVRLSRQSIGDRLQLSECFPVKECALPLRKAEHVINEMIVLENCEMNEEEHLKDFAVSVPGPLV